MVACCVCYMYSYDHFYGKNSTNQANTKDSPNYCDEQEVLNVANQEIPIIKSDTEIEIVQYDLEKHELSTINTAPWTEIIGLDRLGLNAYLSNYLSSPGKEDKDLGLVEYYMISFSSEKVVLRKNFRLVENDEDFKYLIAIKDNVVIVYMSDRKTIFEYTNIHAYALPPDVLDKLNTGIEIYHEEDLYSFLETYSS